MSELSFDVDVCINTGGKGLHRKTANCLSKIFTLYGGDIFPNSGDEEKDAEGSLSFSFTAGEDIEDDKLTHSLYISLNYEDEEYKKENLLMVCIDDVVDIESLRDYLTLFLKNIDKEEKKYEH